LGIAIEPKISLILDLPRSRFSVVKSFDRLDFHRRSFWYDRLDELYLINNLASIRVAVVRTETIMKSFCQLLDSPDVDDVEFFRLLYAIRIHCDYLEKCAIDDIGTSNDKNKFERYIKKNCDILSRN
jgi:hypothetical protein